MTKKHFFLLSLCCWAIVGFFYGLYQLKIETVLLGALRELTLLPAFAGGVIFPLLLLVRLIQEKRN